MSNTSGLTPAVFYVLWITKFDSFAGGVCFGYYHLIYKINYMPHDMPKETIGFPQDYKEKPIEEKYYVVNYDLANNSKDFLKQEEENYESSFHYVVIQEITEHLIRWAESILLDKESPVSRNELDEVFNMHFDKAEKMLQTFAKTKVNYDLSVGFTHRINDIKNTASMLAIHRHKDIAEDKKQALDLILACQGLRTDINVILANIKSFFTEKR